MWQNKDDLYNMQWHTTHITEDIYSTHNHDNDWQKRISLQCKLCNTIQMCRINSLLSQTYHSESDKERKYHVIIVHHHLSEDSNISQA